MVSLVLLYYVTFTTIKKILSCSKMLMVRSHGGHSDAHYKFCLIFLYLLQKNLKKKMS